MDTPKRVIKDEPRKSLFVLFIVSGFFLLIGAVVLIFGSPEREPVIAQAGIVSLAIGGLGYLLYVIARRHEIKRRRHHGQGGTTS